MQQIKHADFVRGGGLKAAKGKAIDEADKIAGAKSKSNRCITIKQLVQKVKTSDAADKAAGAKGKAILMQQIKQPSAKGKATGFAKGKSNRCIR